MNNRKGNNKKLAPLPANSLVLGASQSVATLPPAHHASSLILMNYDLSRSSFGNLNLAHLPSNQAPNKAALLYRPQNRFNLNESLRTLPASALTGASLEDYFNHDLVGASQETEPFPFNLPSHGSQHEGVSVFNDSIHTGSDERAQNRRASDTTSRESARSMDSAVTEQNSLFQRSDQRSIESYLSQIQNASHRTTSAPPDSHRTLEQLTDELMNLQEEYDRQSRSPSRQDTKKTLSSSRSTPVVRAAPVSNHQPQYVVKMHSVSGWNVPDLTSLPINALNFKIEECIYFRESLLLQLDSLLQILDKTYWQYSVLRLRCVNGNIPQALRVEPLVHKRNALFAHQKQLSALLAHIRAISITILESIVKLRRLYHQEIETAAPVTVFFSGTNYLQKMFVDTRSILTQRPSIVLYWLGFLPDPLFIPPPATDIALSVSTSKASGNNKMSATKAVLAQHMARWRSVVNPLLTTLQRDFAMQKERDRRSAHYNRNHRPVYSASGNPSSNVNTSAMNTPGDATPNVQPSTTTNVLASVSKDAVNAMPGQVPTAPAETPERLTRRSGILISQPSDHRMLLDHLHLLDSPPGSAGAGDGSARNRANSNANSNQANPSFPHLLLRMNSKSNNITNNNNASNGGSANPSRPSSSFMVGDQAMSNTVDSSLRQVQGVLSIDTSASPFLNMVSRPNTGQLNINTTINNMMSSSRPPTGRHYNPTATSPATTPHNLLRNASRAVSSTAMGTLSGPITPALEDWQQLREYCQHSWTSVPLTFSVPTKAQRKANHHRQLKQQALETDFVEFPSDVSSLAEKTPANASVVVYFPLTTQQEKALQFVEEGTGSFGYDLPVNDNNGSARIDAPASMTYTLTGWTQRLDESVDPATNSGQGFFKLSLHNQNIFLCEAAVGFAETWPPFGPLIPPLPSSLRQRCERLLEDVLYEELRREQTLHETRLFLAQQQAHHLAHKRSLEELFGSRDEFEDNAAAYSSEQEHTPHGQYLEAFQALRTSLEQRRFHVWQEDLKEETRQKHLAAVAEDALYATSVEEKSTHTELPTAVDDKGKVPLGKAGIICDDGEGNGIEESADKDDHGDGHRSSMFLTQVPQKPASAKPVKEDDHLDQLVDQIITRAPLNLMGSIFQKHSNNGPRFRYKNTATKTTIENLSVNGHEELPQGSIVLTTTSLLRAVPRNVSGLTEATSEVLCQKVDNERTVVTLNPALLPSNQTHHGHNQSHANGSGGSVGSAHSATASSFVEPRTNNIVLTGGIYTLRPDRLHHRTREMDRLTLRFQASHATNIQRIVRGRQARALAKRRKLQRIWRRVLVRLQGVVRGFVHRIREKRRLHAQKIEVYMVRKSALRRFQAAIMIAHWVRRCANYQRLKRQEPLLLDKLDKYGRKFANNPHANALRERATLAKLLRLPLLDFNQPKNIYDGVGPDSLDDGDVPNSSGMAGLYSESTSRAASPLRGTDWDADSQGSSASWQSLDTMSLQSASNASNNLFLSHITNANTFHNQQQQPLVDTDSKQQSASEWAAEQLRLRRDAAMFVQKMQRLRWEAQQQRAPDTLRTSRLLPPSGISALQRQQMQQQLPQQQQAVAGGTTEHSHPNGRLRPLCRRRPLTFLDPNYNSSSNRHTQPPQRSHSEGALHKGSGHDPVGGVGGADGGNSQTTAAANPGSIAHALYPATHTTTATLAAPLPVSTAASSSTLQCAVQSPYEVYVTPIGISRKPLKTTHKKPPMHSQSVDISGTGCQHHDVAVPALSFAPNNSVESAHSYAMSAQAMAASVSSGETRGLQSVRAQRREMKRRREEQESSQLRSALRQLIL